MNVWQKAKLEAQAKQLERDIKQAKRMAELKSHDEATYKIAKRINKFLVRVGGLIAFVFFAAVTGTFLLAWAALVKCLWSVLTN